MALSSVRIFERLFLRNSPNFGTLAFQWEVMHREIVAENSD